MATVQELVDAAEITTTCPKCGAQAQQKVGRLRADKAFTCAACGATDAVDFAEFDKKVAAIERELTETLNRLPKWFNVTR